MLYSESMLVQEDKIAFTGLPCGRLVLDRLSKISNIHMNHQEPVIYVSGRPHVLRLVDRPLENVEYVQVTFMWI